MALYCPEDHEKRKRHIGPTILVDGCSEDPRQEKDIFDYTYR